MIWDKTYDYEIINTDIEKLTYLIEYYYPLYRTQGTINPVLLSSSYPNTYPNTYPNPNPNPNYILQLQVQDQRQRVFVLERPNTRIRPYLTLYQTQRGNKDNIYKDDINKDDINKDEINKDDLDDEAEERQRQQDLQDSLGN